MLEEITTQLRISCLRNCVSLQVQWRSKSEFGPDAKTGELVFPTNFDRNLPSEMATSQTLSYYGKRHSFEVKI